MRRLLIGLLLTSAGLASAQEDWAGLGRFVEANAALGAPADGEARVVFIGDSITEGWLNASPQFFSERPFINRGISGQTTAQMLIRFRQDVVSLDPAAVVILAGTNDLAGNTGPASNEMIQDNLASMAEIAAENDIRVVLASILPADGYPWAPDVAPPAPRIAAINDWLRQYAEDNDHLYLDYYSVLVNESGGMLDRYTYDGVHVTADGYAVMEARALATIADALDSERRRSGGFYFRPADNDCVRTSSRRTNPRSRC
jgi:lysophospholipase L1-like esterase